MYGRYSELAQFAKEFKATQQRKNLLARNRKEGLLIGEGGKKKKSLKKRMFLLNIYNEFDTYWRRKSNWKYLSYIKYQYNYTQRFNSAFRLVEYYCYKGDIIGWFILSQHYANCHWGFSSCQIYLFITH